MDFTPTTKIFAECSLVDYSVPILVIKTIRSVNELFLDSKLLNLRSLSSSTNSKTNEATSTSTTATTSTPITKEEASSRAKSILAMLPGDTAFSKTAYATIGTGLGAFLIAKGIYIPNDETLVLAAFAITIRALYTKLSGPVSEYLENSINVKRK